MAFQIYFQQEAIIDIQDTYLWYSFDEFRDARLKRFPYLVIFKIEGKKVYINSVKHIHSRPGS